MRNYSKKKSVLQVTAHSFFTQLIHAQPLLNVNDK